MSFHLPGADRVSARCVSGADAGREREVPAAAGVYPVALGHDLIWL